MIPSAETVTSELLGLIVKFSDTVTVIIPFPLPEVGERDIHGTDSLANHGIFDVTDMLNILAELGLFDNVGEIERKGETAP